jgi:hypothetical protein
MAMSNSYFSKLNHKDFQYREDGGFIDLSDKINYYRDIYANSFVEITSFQKERIYLIKEQLEKLISKNLNKKYHILNRVMFKIALLNDNKKIEGGFPHTLDDIIILRESFFQYSYRKQLETLAHELVHIYQRNYKDEYLPLVEQMGFIPSTVNIRFIPSANPDIDDIIYTYKFFNNLLYIMNVYSNDREMNFKSIGVYTDKIVEIDFNSYMSQQGHPNEIIAELLARVICGNKNIRSDWYKMVCNV